MEKEFIPYEQALILKELGFNENCFGWYDLHQLVLYKINNSTLNKHPIKCSALLWQQAFDYLLELSNYTTKPIIYKNLNNTYCCSGINCNTLYEAKLVKLKKLIEIVKNK